MSKTKTAESAKVPGLFRQGDVLLRPVAAGAVPLGVKRVATEKGRVILAHGEKTGHHHSLPATESELFVDDATGSRFLRCIAGSVLSHQEHDPLQIPAGDYEVIAQMEYTPQEIVRVLD